MTNLTKTGGLYHLYDYSPLGGVLSCLSATEQEINCYSRSPKDWAVSTLSFYSCITVDSSVLGANAGKLSVTLVAVSVLHSTTVSIGAIKDLAFSTFSDTL